MEIPDKTNCPIKRTTDVVGDQWSFLIMRELVLEGPRRFKDFEDVLSVSPNTLSARLKKLEDAGVIRRKFYSTHPPRAEYHLTKKGESLKPVIGAMYDWGMGPGLKQ